MAAPRVILGISSGTRSIGLAVIRNGDLVDWKIKTFRGEWSEEKLAYILRKLEAIYDYFEVSAIALKKVDAFKGSRQLEMLNEHLEHQAKGKSKRIVTYSIHDLHAITGRRYKSAKKSIAEFVLDTYPRVRNEYLKERNNKREYYAKMFEAVLCAHILYKKESDF